MGELQNFTEELSSIHKWGIEFIKSIQTVASEPLTEFVKIFTDLSVYGFVIIACAVFIWCIYKGSWHL